MVLLTEVDMAIGYTPSGYHVRACCLEVIFLIRIIIIAVRLSSASNYSVVFSFKLPGIMTISRDAVGNITSLKGISAEMLDWMSLAFNFT